MGVAAHNRGSRLASMELDNLVDSAMRRVSRQACKDEVTRLRDQVTALERELRRARRCLAAERAGRENLRVRLSNEERAYDFAVGIMCKIAFSEPTGDDR